MKKNEFDKGLKNTKERQKNVINQLNLTTEEIKKQGDELLKEISKAKENFTKDILSQEEIIKPLDDQIKLCKEKQQIEMNKKINSDPNAQPHIRNHFFVCIDDSASSHIKVDRPDDQRKIIDVSIEILNNFLQYGKTLHPEDEFTIFAFNNRHHSTK